MIAVVLISLAAACKALADTLAWHFDTSIFRNMNRDFWAIAVTIKKTPKIFGYPIDAWHLSNSIAIFSWMALPLVYKPHFAWYVDYGIGGLIFIIVFNTFYNKIFR